jgi:hypothetical protein
MLAVGLAKKQMDEIDVGDTKSAVVGSEFGESRHEHE